jgi:hypothetical protein
VKTASSCESRVREGEIIELFSKIFEEILNAAWTVIFWDLARALKTLVSQTNGLDDAWRAVDKMRINLKDTNARLGFIEFFCFGEDEEAKIERH